jgi:hypothetical protein
MNRIPLASLLGFLFSFSAKETYLIAIQCRMDESFDDRVFSVGAVFAKDLGWQCLEGEWAAIFKPEGIKYFRTSDCLSVSGEFRKFRKERLQVTEVERRKAWEIMNKLVRAVAENRVTIVGFSVDMKAFRDVVNTPEKQEVFGGSHYYHCYYHAMAMCVELIRNANYQAAFGYDEDQQYGPPLREAYSEFKKRSPEYARHMSTLTPFDDKLLIPLQVADLAASIVRRYSESVLSQESWGTSS